MSAVAPVTRTETVALEPPELWELLWRDETQSRWLGPGSEIDLAPGRRCVLRDEAGPWRTACVVSVVVPKRLVLAVEPAPAWTGGHQVRTVTITLTRAAVGATKLTVTESAVPSTVSEEVSRYWSRRLELASELAHVAIHRRQEARQAIVVIHGMGEQQPGVTLQNFVDSGVIAEDPVGGPAPPAGVSAAGKEAQSRYVKPDRLSGSFELRRTQFRRSKDGQRPRTDVFEFYWAHMIRDTTVGQVAAWAGRLLFRRDVPPPLIPIIWLGRALAVLIVVVVVLSAIGTLPSWAAGGGVAAVLAGLAWKLSGKNIITQVLGDAARYLTPLPDNIAHRQAIREAGVQLIERLHEDGAYDRIILVGHSLGSVIAYDIITYAWIGMNTRHRGPRKATFSDLRAVERALTKAPNSQAAQELQHTAWRCLRRNTQPWLVTDLVTVGSPLTYARFLLATTDQQFEQLRADRILPTCPPVHEVEARSGFQRITFDAPYRAAFSGPRHRPTFTFLHHAAPFAVTRWTNLYFKAEHLGLKGDPIGGPLADLLGSWVHDIELTSPTDRVAHTWYWRRAPGESRNTHIDVLRDALRLEERYALLDLLARIPAFALLDRDGSRHAGHHG